MMFYGIIMFEMVMMLWGILFFELLCNFKFCNLEFINSFFLDLFIGVFFFFMDRLVFGKFVLFLLICILYVVIFVSSVNNVSLNF